MNDPSSVELIRRFHALEEHVRLHPELFEVTVPFVAGSGASDSELVALEAETGVALPPTLRAVACELAGARWGWSLHKALEAEWDADVTGASGGMQWLTVAEIKPAAARLGRAASALGAPLLPFAKDASGIASWLAVAKVDKRVVVVQAALDGHVERWSFQTFIDDWSRGGFRIADRWEDQPEQVVEHFANVLGLDDDEAE